MIDEKTGIKIQYTPEVFDNYTQPNGFLTLDRACQACFKYVMLASKNRIDADRTIDTQIVLEGQMWSYAHTWNIKKSVAKVYGLKHPDEMDAFFPNVTMTLRLEGIEVDPRILATNQNKSAFDEYDKRD